MQHFGVTGYDPHWKPDRPVGWFDTITCNYVLNVVSEDMQELILVALKDLLARSGHAYITVRRDIPREGKLGRGTWQRYVELELPLLTQNKGFAIYVMNKVLL